MSEDTGERDNSSRVMVTSKVAMTFAAALTGAMFFLDDLLGLINGGGMFSVVSSLRAAGNHVAEIGVDSAGLRTIFALLCSVLVFVPLRVFRFTASSKALAWIAALSILGGAFILDGVYDQSIVGHLLASHGYSRCENGDYHVGTGKGRVWFDDYVLNRASCPPRGRIAVRAP